MRSLAEDIVEIQQVLAQYSLALDSRRPELMAGCFADGAVVQLGEAINMTAAEYITMSGQTLPTIGATQHILGLPLIHIQGDKAWSRCYFMAQHVKNELSPSAFMIGGWYADEWIRTENGWRITKRRGCPLWADGNADVLGGNFPGGAIPKGPEHAAPFWLETPR
jgi:hypothetical protein